jgi:hypothetical protein
MINKKTMELFLIEYNMNKDYFECHEIMEEAWKKNVLNKKRNCDYVVLLQIAVCLFHLRECNYSGAKQMYQYIIRNCDEAVLSNLEYYFLKNDIIDMLDELNKCVEEQIYKHLYLRSKNEKI